MSTSLFAEKFHVMGGSLGLRLARHDLTATNLANIDVPGYQVRHLNFEKVLVDQLAMTPNQLDPISTDVKHINTRDVNRAFRQAQHTVKVAPYGKDEYGDDILEIDKEMTLLTKNQLIYNTTVQMLAQSFDGLKKAMEG